ncbi:2-aminoadipate transaminase [Conyzicola lurida]|uniref:2-aminoadipate transaminase n=1 Tax=Conyzicola lurida TaxID=1172621 RepID=A0A841AMR9_9MICO|nr:PLP-dependent aminotransferase family protein [Conyzicola lurida]MBB5842825.1 2-aminoadipate transaminase [Conyzicola lurida]
MTTTTSLPPALAARVTDLRSPSAFGSVLGDVRSDAIALTGGSPALEALPREALVAATATVLADAPRAARALDYSAHQGHAGLREWIAAREGVDAGRVVISNGALHALSLTFLATVDPGDTVVVEDPVYPLVAKVLQLAEARVEAVPVDADGLDVAELERRLEAGLRARALYVVPDFHNPTGRVLSAGRRERLVELAELYGFLVVSDNPYVELRGTGDRLADLDLSSDRVVHVNTFSKTLGPGLRLGWAVLPAAVVPGFLDLRSRLDQHASSLTQEIVAEYVGGGAFDELVAAASALYRRRAVTFTDALSEALGDAVAVSAPDGGVFAWPRLVDDRVSVADFARSAAANGVLVIPGEQFAVDSPDAARHFRASFGQQNKETLVEAAARLGTAYAELETTV